MKNSTQKIAVVMKTLLLTSFFAASSGVYADDTEVFYSVNVSKPNLMFVLDYSQSMQSDVANSALSSGGGNRSRLEVLQSSLRSVLEAADDNVNIGIMQYGQGQRARASSYTLEEGNRTHGVNGVSFPLRDINAKANETVTDATGVCPTVDANGNTITYDKTTDYSWYCYLPYVPGPDVTVREYVIDIIETWGLNHETPIVDSLYEAALYYRGEKMYYGNHQPNELPGAHPSTYVTTGVSRITSDIDVTPRDQSTAPNYISPIKSSCQANYIVMMSDGGPANRYDRTILNGVWQDPIGLSPTQTDVTSNNNKSFSWGYRGPFAQNMLGDSTYSGLAGEITTCVDSPSSKKAGKCGPELMAHLALADQSDEYEDIQTIKSFIIGFGGISGNNQSYLESLATGTYDDDADASTDPVKGYFDANDEADLVSAFASILKEVSEPIGTLASPGYSVNVKSGLEHEKDIYIPVFDRKNTSRWAGNLKKFKIVEDGDLRKIQGKNDLDAVDELGGFSVDALDYWSDADDDSPDGTDVQKGGLANLLEPSERNIVSDIVNNNLSTNASNLLVDTNAALTNEVLGLPGLADSNADEAYRKQVINFMRGWEDGIVTANDPNLNANENAQKISGTYRKHMGDMLHSEPLVVTYDDGESTGTSGTRKQYIFAGTNEGYMHAFDTADAGATAGKEMFAFIPSELLKTISEPQFLNAGTQADHKYGVDGSMSYRFIDNNDDGIVNNSDQVILYFGLRRGGSSYYALDVTDIENPNLLWKVSNTDTGTLSRMGQSWSAPYLARVGVADSTETCQISSGVTKSYCKEVMIVTAGYDVSDDRDERYSCSDENGTCTIPDNNTATVWYGANDTWVSKSGLSGSISCSNSFFGDPLVGTRKSCEVELNNGEYDSTSQVTATVGNDVFIFDADDGDLVWSLPSTLQTKLTNSTPGGLRMLDTNSNKLVDRFYFGDTGGNLWRLDLSESIGSINSSDTTSTLEKLADLSGTGVNARMFYNEPDVSSMKLNGKTKFLVSIGSGFRAHPLDKVIEDKYFMIVDHSPYSPLDTDPTSTNTFTETTTTQLAQITVTSSGSVTQTDSIKDGFGWMINLPSDGEKVLAPSVTVDGVALFTTLVPEVLEEGVGIDQCEAPPTQGRIYAIDILSGEPASAPLGFSTTETVTDSGGTSTETTNFPYSLISKGEIPGKPQAVFNSLEVDDATGTCTHPVDIRIGKKLSQATGYEACRLESIYWSDPATK